MLPVSLDCPSLIGPTYSLTFICFVCLRLVYPLLTVSLDCPSLIGPTVFSNVYFFCLFCLCVLSLFLPVSLDCSLIGPTVFSNVYLFCLSSSCVPFIASFSGLSMFDWPYGIL
jgi:hypothetical protein